MLPSIASPIEVDEEPDSESEELLLLRLKGSEDKREETVAESDDGPVVLTVAEENCGVAMGVEEGTGKDEKILPATTRQKGMQNTVCKENASPL
jgi:hypothetical protein